MTPRLSYKKHNGGAHVCSVPHTKGRIGGSRRNKTRVRRRRIRKSNRRSRVCRASRRRRKYRRRR